MNNSNPQKLSPVKIALMELVMFGEYGVSDKVGICEFIERMDSIQLESLAKTLMLLDTESDQKFLLESVYNEELQQKNSNVYMTESIFSKSRDQIILQEAEEIPANVAEILNETAKNEGVLQNPPIPTPPPTPNQVPSMQGGPQPGVGLNVPPPTPADVAGGANNPRAIRMPIGGMK